jgi:Replication initiator protein A
LQTTNARRVSGGNGDVVGGLESAGSFMKRTGPELVVAKQKFRQAEGSCIVRMQREEGKQNVGFSSRPFVLCGLPVRKPPKSEMLYERRNGNFVLQITGHPNYGLPFGQDRIVPIYLATLAVRQQSQTIRFRTAAEMLETFGMHKGGKEYRRPVAAFERIFGATIFFGADALRGTAKVVQRARFSFFNVRSIGGVLRPCRGDLDPGAAAWKPGPESAEPFALPSDNRVCLDVDQGTAPVGPDAAKGNPKRPVQGRQQWAFPLSLKCGYLHW